MRFPEILKKTLKIFFRFIVPLLYFILILTRWNHVMIILNRIMLLNFIILVVGINKCCVLYRIYLRKSASEYEVTLALTLVKIINTIE